MIAMRPKDLRAALEKSYDAAIADLQFTTGLPRAQLRRRFAMLAMDRAGAWREDTRRAIRRAEYQRKTYLERATTIDARPNRPPRGLISERQSIA
jgi:hypothetical protein